MLKIKLAVLEEFLILHQITWTETLYMGDDIPDLPAMKKAGMPCAPADAAPEILQSARYISPLWRRKRLCTGRN